MGDAQEAERRATLEVLDSLGPITLNEEDRRIVEEARRRTSSPGVEDEEARFAALCRALNEALWAHLPREALRLVSEARDSGAWSERTAVLSALHEGLRNACAVEGQAWEYAKTRPAQRIELGFHHPETGELSTETVRIVGTEETADGSWKLVVDSRGTRATHDFTELDGAGVVRLARLRGVPITLDLEEWVLFVWCDFGAGKRVCDARSAPEDLLAFIRLRLAEICRGSVDKLARLVREGKVEESRSEVEYLDSLGLEGLDADGLRVVEEARRLVGAEAGAE
jgi:hypothetical protein